MCSIKEWRKDSKIKCNDKFSVPESCWLKAEVTGTNPGKEFHPIILNINMAIGTPLIFPFIITFSVFTRHELNIILVYKTSH